MSQTEESVSKIDLTEEEVSDVESVDSDDEVFTMETLLSSTLMTENGDTVCSALVNVGRQLEVQNKILVKMLSALLKRA